MSQTSPHIHNEDPLASKSRQPMLQYASSTADRALDPVSGLRSPSDGLGQEPLSLSKGGHRSQRKAAPSPLQTSSVADESPHRTPATPPARTTFVKPATGSLSVTSFAANILPRQSEEPRSPKERLDDLLASERSFYTSDDVDPGPATYGYQSRVEGLVNVPKGSVRSVSDPLAASTTKGASAVNPRTIPMASNALNARTKTASPVPRNSSIDSVISNISSNNLTHKSSKDVPMAEAADIANLVQAAGSSDAVIQYLLKEKHSLGAQNTQLWRLVDKQRAMILGLNKDLERALKDKDRYRKKLKETLAASSNVTQISTTVSVPRDGSSDSHASSQKSKHVEAPVSAGPRSQDELPPSPIDVALAPYPVTPPAHIVTHSKSAQALHSAPLANLVEAEHKMPAPSEHAFQHYDSEAKQAARKMSEVTALKYKTSVPPSRALPADPPMPRNIATGTVATPTFAITEAPLGSVEQLQPFPAPPSRKGPPAPLQLGQAPTTSAHLHQAEVVEEEDSDYDDLLDVDSIPLVSERGRRKTREQDDREREVAAQKDAELRSPSNPNKSRPTTPKTEHTPPPTYAGAVGISPPQISSSLLAPPDAAAGSLAGMLSVDGQDSDVISQQVISQRSVSAGLPLSPRPIDRGLSSPSLRADSDAQSQTSPPISPTSVGLFASIVPLSPRAPRHAIPLPPYTPLSVTSPEGTTSAEEPTDRKDVIKDTVPANSNSIYQGFVVEEYPELLISPDALPSIDVRVASSRLKPSRQSLMFPMKLDEDPVFTLAIFSRADGKELWRVEKDSTSLANMDQLLRQSSLHTAKAPERSLFNGHAPAKIDARRAALDRYLNEVLNTQLELSCALELCLYLSINAMEPHWDGSVKSGESRGESPQSGPGGRPVKNGYLTKRGKNFGGWKARFFVLDGPLLKYYEAPGGAHLGSIKLPHAEIGKQAQQAPPTNGDQDEIDNQYRHAFLIMEPKKKDSSSKVRHVLCAESDTERDQWVAALLQYVDYLSEEDDEDDRFAGHARMTSGDSGRTTGSGHRKRHHGHTRGVNLAEIEEDGLKGMSYETTSQGSAPYGARARNNAGSPSPPYERDSSSRMGHSAKAISAPKNATLIADTGSWGHRSAMLSPPTADEKKIKKRSFFGFGTKPRPSVEAAEPNSESTTSLTQMSYDQHGPIRPVFGAPLSEAVRYNHPADVQVDLPAVVYRCIEYLDAKGASSEEGIFRLSGSNVVIKQLRERFNIEGDVNLITDEQYYDIHAVASLLKLYLRELPTTILTRELHLDFLAVTELKDINEKIIALNELVHRMPRCNGTLLRYLAGFLINIINNSDVNKMTVRNVGIVFSPTLNIPAPVFALFLQQYEGIFDAEPQSDMQSPGEFYATPPAMSPEDTPRHQHFQDAPTPSYQQQNFSRSQNQHGPHGDSGYAQMTPSYETHLQSHTMGGPEYGSRAPTLAGPAYDQLGSGGAAFRQNSGDRPSTSGNARTKRRESSMFAMGLSNKKSTNKMKENNDRLVDDESYFE